MKIEGRSWIYNEMSLVGIKRLSLRKYVRGQALLSIILFI